jgi:sugar phosphate isomerase/epimerase
MKIAICNETFDGWPHPRALERAQQLGYVGVEVAPFTLDADARQITRSMRLDFVNHAAQAGLEIIGLHWLFARTQGLHLTSRDRDVVRRTQDYLRTLVDLCFDLGGSIMVLGSPQQRRLEQGVERAEGVKILGGILREVEPALAATGIRIAIEPLGPAECNFLRTAQEAVELIEYVDSPHVRLHLDVKAMSTESRPVPQIIAENAGRFIHFHANDPNRRGPGMGDVDFLPILRALQEIGYDGWLSVEVFDYAPGAETLASESIAYLRKCMSQLEDPS